MTAMPSKKPTNVTPTGRTMIKKSIGSWAVGKCKHRYEYRQDISPWELRNVPATPENVAKLETFLERMREYREQSMCPTCEATSNLALIRNKVERLSHIVGLDPPPLFDGTLRQQSYAETLRFERLLRSVGHQAATVRSTMNTRSGLEQLAVIALKRLLEDKGMRGGEESKDLRDLKAELAAVDVSRMDRMKPTQALAVWLVVRTEWKSDRHIFWDHSPKAWIASQGFKMHSTYNDVSISTVNTAILTAELTNWNSRDEAWDAFTALSSDSRDAGTRLLSIISDSSVSSWSDAFEQLDVWNALTEDNNYLRPPF